jgi:hypothetical protein
MSVCVRKIRSARKQRNVYGNNSEMRGFRRNGVSVTPDVPERIRPRLDEVLRHNAAAFRVGGHLGHVAEKAPIPLKPGTQPISEPMYAASPLKRDVIDKQMDLWFEHNVIEPSVSP